MRSPSASVTARGLTVVRAKISSWSEALRSHAETPIDKVAGHFINFLPNAIYKPEVCIRTTLAAAEANGFPLDLIIFEVTEGERVEDGP